MTQSGVKAVYIELIDLFILKEGSENEWVDWGSVESYNMVFNKRCMSVYCYMLVSV